MIWGYLYFRQPPCFQSTVFRNHRADPQAVAQAGYVAWVSRWFLSLSLPAHQRSWNWKLPGTHVQWHRSRQSFPAVGVAAVPSPRLESVGENHDFPWQNGRGAREPPGDKMTAQSSCFLWTKNWPGWDKHHFVHFLPYLSHESMQVITMQQLAPPRAFAEHWSSPLGSEHKTPYRKNVTHKMSDKTW